MIFLDTMPACFRGEKPEAPAAVGFLIDGFASRRAMPCTLALEALARRSAGT